MKIAFFTETYHPQVNGVVTVIDAYKKELEARGHKVYIFAPKPGKKEKDVFRFKSTKFKPYPEYMISLPGRGIVKRMREIRPDVIHLHGPFTSAMIGLTVGKIFNIPTVITYHTHITEYTQYLSKYGKNITKKIAAKYVKWFHNRADIVISPSKSIEKELRIYGVKKPIRVISTGVDFKIKNRKQNINKIPIILHVGRLCKEKEVDVIIKVLKKIEKGNLIITSKGPDEERLKSIVKKLELTKRVKFTGYISDKHRDILYKKADMFISASSSETQGLVVLEAMSYGCPVIVRNARGFNDIVKNNVNGILFNKDAEIPSKIDMVLNSKFRKKIIKNGYETVKEYSMENTIDKIENLYKKLIENN
ncbi:MAG: glycosyltransferase [Nanoarchaeota archaeon]|nr:glycosyltransferase [Nanoarchaeota archaeon]MBU4124268.1 glycosyltransferase [Nanoarchaeota archaeon]